MSIEKITSKIISDAEAEAKVTLDAAKAECDAILAEAEKAAEEIMSKAEAEAKEEKEKLISRRKSVAEIDGRKIVLEAKQQLIAECFDKAIDSVAAMDRQEYVAFLVKLVKKTGQTEGEIILNAKDAKTIGEELIKAVAGEIPASRITLSKETRDIRGGFLLKKDAVFVNSTLEALIEEAKVDLTGEVAAKLF